MSFGGAAHASLVGLSGSKRDVGGDLPRVAPKLSAMEAAHVYAVISKMMSHLSLVGAIMVDPQIQAQQMTQNVGEEISRMIAEQKELEKKFQGLIEQQQALRGVVNQSKLKEKENEVKMVSEALRESTAKLCRNLKSNPNVAENINKVARQRLDLLDLLNRSLAELHQKKKLFSVRDHVEEQEKARREEEARAIEQRRLAEEVKKRKAERQDEESKHTAEMTRRKEQLAKEKERLKLVKVDYEKEAIYTRRSKLGMNECQRNLNNAQLERLQDEVFRLRQEIAVEERVHAEIMAFESNKLKELQQRTLHWKHSLERDGARMEKETLNVNNAHQNAIKQETAVRDEYERELRYKRERDERIVSRRLSEAFKDPAVRARYNRCALVVQRVWRGHQIRYRLKEGVGGALVKSWEEQKRAEEEAEAARLAELERIAAGEEAPESIEGGAGGEAQAAGAGDEATAGGGGDGAEGEGGGEAAGAEGDSPDGGEAAPAAPAMEVAPTEVAAA